MIKLIKRILSYIFPPSRTFLRMVVNDLFQKIERLLTWQTENLEHIKVKQLETLDRIASLAEQSLANNDLLLSISLKLDNNSDEYETLRSQCLLAAESSRELIEQSRELIEQNNCQIDLLKPMSGQLFEQLKILENLAVRQNNQILYLRGISDRQKTSIADMSRANNNLLMEFEKQNKAIASFDQNKKIVWNDEFERRLVSMNWGNVSDSPDFEEKFLKLTSGMDAESVLKITRILSRQKKFLNPDAKNLDIYTRAEQEELRLLRENFYNDVFCISEQLYIYKNYLLPINQFEPSVFYFKHGIDELKTSENVRGKAIIDVGGFVGDSALILSDLEPSTIYTFEAEPENFKLLKKTLELNNRKNVVAENVALSDSQGELVIHVAGSCSTTINRPGIKYTDEVVVPMTTLDDYVAEHNINIGLIKVDIEGGEPKFLQGAIKTICEQKPILLLSIYHNAHDFFELKPLIESWNLGYSFRIHKPTIGNTTSETLLLAEIC